MVRTHAYLASAHPVSSLELSAVCTFLTTDGVICVLLIFTLGLLIVLVSLLLIVLMVLLSTSRFRTLCTTASTSLSHWWSSRAPRSRTLTSRSSFTASSLWSISPSCSPQTPPSRWQSAPTSQLWACSTSSQSLSWTGVKIIWWYWADWRVCSTNTLIMPSSRGNSMRNDDW